MPPSELSWLDHDAAAAERSMRLLSMFQERESRDELGIGGIRDSIADQLFPGTSTIQTRLRYVFFIPWQFARLDERHTKATAFPAASREAESRLLAALLQNEPTSAPGIIGREAGSTLKRMPSSVYWAGLGSWGIRRADLSLQQYFGQADLRDVARRSRRRRDDDEWSEADASGEVWHPQLMKLRPVDFPESAVLSLTRPESELLLDLWRSRHPDSLLTWLALDMASGHESIQAVRAWAHPRFASFPAQTRTLLDHARRFDVLVRGAALLYNLQLAEMGSRQELEEAYRTELAKWSADEAPSCRDWQLSAFWPRVLGQGHTITGETQRFIEAWHRLSQLPSLVSPADSKEARELVGKRERRLKGPRSRLQNPAALAQWGGRAGLEPLTYRWPTTTVFLNDWLLGWRQS